MGSSHQHQDNFLQINQMTTDVVRKWVLSVLPMLLETMHNRNQWGCPLWLILKGIKVSTPKPYFHIYAYYNTSHNKQVMEQEMHPSLGECLRKMWSIHMELRLFGCKQEENEFITGKRNFKWSSIMLSDMTHNKYE